ncbi:MAG TPA: hypothetical protein VLD57_12845 [Blastocatellia bacterium]|nr:hypothetical protein [Blastocatellia bacterium]
MKAALKESPRFVPGPGRLSAEIVPVDRLDASDTARMFQLMRQYYDGVTQDRFLLDLSNKQAVILLRNDAEGEIHGFSTLRLVRVQTGDKILRGVFSGDTVIDKRFWGQRALGRAFLRFLFFEKLRHPLVPLYWLLISKGYKTYLMMANNFSEHYPRFERPMPEDRKAVMDAFYLALYPDDYDPATGLIKVADQTCRLKTGVAAISDLLLESNPRIAFFQKANPQWASGVELACIARMTLFMPFYYAIKSFVTDRVISPSMRLCRFMFSVPKERSHTND